MTSFTTFYLSRIIGSKVFDTNGNFIGVVKDLLADTNYSNNPSDKPRICGIKIKKRGESAIYSFDHFNIEKIKKRLKIICLNLIELSPSEINSCLFLTEAILDQQIVDLNGRKLVRVNDVRLVSLSRRTLVVAVDIGMEGLLRRIGIEKPLKLLFLAFRLTIPSKFILWEDVEAIDYSNFNIKLSKSYSKLQTLHPSDLADIIEDLGKKSRTDIFAALDEEQAADVLEELEAEVQIHIVESLPVEKVADVLEKMPADEVADILDALESDKAESLLSEMEKGSSQEVRELLEYPSNTVGSMMSTNVLMFREDNTVADVFEVLLSRKPEKEELFTLFVTDESDRLIATFSLRDLVISLPNQKISQIMKESPVHLHDYQETDDIAVYMSKYNLLAIPVVDNSNVLHGMVGIDDVIDDLISKRRTNK